MHSVISRFSSFDNSSGMSRPESAKFADPLLHQCVAFARIVFRLLHLLDQVSELSAAHLLRHDSRFSRFRFLEATA